MQPSNECLEAGTACEHTPVRPTLLSVNLRAHTVGPTLLSVNLRAHTVEPTFLSVNVSAKN